MSFRTIILFALFVEFVDARCICCECYNGKPLGVCVQDMNQDAMDPSQVCALYNPCPNGYKTINAFEIGNKTCNSNCATDCKFGNDPTYKHVGAGKNLTANTYPFQLYAPPMAYGMWYKSGHGIAGKASVTISVDPLADTTLFCEINCCGKTAKFMDSVTCQWDCIGQPSVRCYGNPVGSAVQATQTS
jgi:hypothetical protein